MKLKTQTLVLIGILLVGLLIAAPVQARNWYDDWTSDCMLIPNSTGIV